MRLFTAILVLTLSACSIGKTPGPPPRPSGETTPETRPSPQITPPAPEPEASDSEEPQEKPRDSLTKDGSTPELSDFFFGDFESDKKPRALDAAPGGWQKDQIQLWALAQAAKTEGTQKFFMDLARQPLFVTAVDSETGEGLFHKLATGDMVAAVHALKAAHLTKNISLRDKQGRLPIHSAKSVLMLKELWDVNSPVAPGLDGQTPLMRLAQLADYRPLGFAVEKLCVTGAWFPAFHKKHVNDADPGGRTALHFAAANASVQAIDSLLRCEDTNLVARDSLGRTPLHYVTASLRNSTAATYALLERARLIAPDTYRSYFDLPDRAGDTALHIARRCENARVVSLLLYFGANRDVKNAAGEAPLNQTSFDCPEIISRSAEK